MNTAFDLGGCERVSRLSFFRINVDSGKVLIVLLSSFAGTM